MKMQKVEFLHRQFFMDDKESIEIDRHIIKFLLASFPDTQKMTDGRSWLPLHFAVALRDKLSEEDVHVLYSSDPLAWRRFSRREHAGYTLVHFLCMQTHPDISLVRYLSMRDIKGVFSAHFKPMSFRCS